jgi:hypothetical protein
MELTVYALRKHVTSNHFNILKRFEKEVNCPLKEDEKQLSKKRPKNYSNSISSFFVAKEPFKKNNLQ